ncbi:MAG: hypothetical protein CL878_13450, partial [Dehalococcoidia bacterium]|nr:hypothetical protein [Dehalococcoidia bacterium]
HTHWLTDETLAWLRQRQPEQPFFCWLSYLDPHHPFCPPRPYCDLHDPDDLPDPIALQEDLADKPPHYRWQREGQHFYYGSFDTGQGGVGRHAREIKAHYYGMISFVDEQIGRVLAELDRLGLRENTHVIFTSDHGDALLDHDVFGKPPLAYESILRVPLLWRHPPLVRAGRVHTGVMTQLDFAPTVLELAGAPPLPGMEGRSFASLLGGLADEHRDAVVVERIALERHTSEPVVRYKTLITEQWKLVHYGSASAGELYDLKADPEQRVNLWSHPGHADQRRNLAERLLTELIDSELGDAAQLWRRQREEPFGALRDLRRSESSWPDA